MSWVIPAVRGQILRVEIGLSEPKLVVVVSNNFRNRRLNSVLAVRMTTTPKPTIPSIVELPANGNFEGRVICDDIIEIFEDEVLGVVGAVDPITLRSINDGLRAALALV